MTVYDELSFKLNKIQKEFRAKRAAMALKHYNTTGELTPSQKQLYKKLETALIRPIRIDKEIDDVLDVIFDEETFHPDIFKL